MHAIRVNLPASPLREYIRFYAQREGQTGGIAEVHPVPARAFPLLEFVFGDRFQVRYPGQGIVQTSPRTVVVGLQTQCRRQLHFQGTAECFVILFQPAGLQRLFPVPILELTDQAYEAHAVLGAIVSQLESRLGEGRDFHERVRIADGLLLPHCFGARSSDRISTAASRILAVRGNSRVSTLAHDAGLSVRQFERRFREQVGVHPKLYQRIVRFEAALDTKARMPLRSWTDVAYEFGYHDQMHMIHDFRAFAGATPTETLKVVEVVFRGRLGAIRSGGVLRNPTSDVDLII